MIIASAGHVDHGKTALLHAITGINADRLPEEKARGMTIDLGYAYWPQYDGRVIGFIDVPGHEKFLTNMLSGTGGLDHSLLAVAADDGVMPQTREHLAILQLNGQPPLTVAITKADRADESRLLEVEQQIRELTTQLGWPEIALFVTSVTESRGIGELASHLRQLPSRSRDENKRFRLAIDRAFNVKGTGTVVTGTALGGKVSVGDKLWLTGMDKAVRVRGLHAQNQPTEVAYGGQRIALNITGGVEKSEISRGDWLLETRAESPTERLIVALTLHQPLQQGQPLHIHHAASHITGRVSVLDGDLAELRLDTPLWLADNDRLILRDIAARQTLAGARVVLLTPKKRGKRQPDYLHWLHQLTAAENDGQALECYLQEHPCRKELLAWARQLTPSAMANELEALKPVEAGDYLMLTGSIAKWQALLHNTLSDYHQHHGDRPGLGRDRLRRMALPNQPEEVGLALIDLLTASGELGNNHGWLHLPEFSIDFLPEEAQLWQRAEPLLAEGAWWVRDMAEKLGVEEELMRHTLRKAAQSGFITAIVKDRYFSSEKMKSFAELIRQRDQAGQSTSAADFRDQLAVGRKLAVQVLEFFDRSGFTRRKGNEHLLRDSDMFS
ncbi:selenocysteine-specific translation elongation factor [Pantoea sp. BAV 3049]|uniref:selenocysteine-specific translation elongation factor n=1 Tax=Pantoea sp. BAV 3049 TaxID=2654188 RepID=UPI00131C3A82|nr:selenocysteine-specific translation elongation factor [Pantoea sp. BAV 3049]